jgi:hypothetical protein
MLEQLSAIASKGIEPISEVFKETAIKCIKDSPLQSSMETIENTSLESLKAQNIINSENIAPHVIKNNTLEPIQLHNQFKIKNIETNAFEDKILSDYIKKDSGWSEPISSSIKSLQEYQIYKNASLSESDINGRKCLIRTDIDWKQKDSYDRSNYERSSEFKLSAISKDGEVLELHHIGQKSDGPLAELTPDQHRSKENYSVLHNSKTESQIDRKLFDFERGEHWKTRAILGGIA